MEEKNGREINKQQQENNTNKNVREENRNEENMGRKKKKGFNDYYLLTLIVVIIPDGAVRCNQLVAIFEQDFHIREFIYEHPSEHCEGNNRRCPRRSRLCTAKNIKNERRERLGKEIEST